MLTVSNELRNAFMKDERTIYVRIKIGNRTFDNNNVISVDYDAGSLSGEVFAIGSTYSNSIKITFSELVEGLKELDEVTYEIGIKLANGKIEYVPMGVFVINDAIEMDRNNNKTTIECMDRMVMMGGTYVSSLNYPAAIREVALEIANKAGIAVAYTFDRLSADVIAKPEGYTYREAIGLIAQFEAGFATFDRYGKLEIRTLSDPNFAIPPDNYFSKGLVKNEVFFRLGGISCTNDDSDTVIQSGNTAGNQVVLENRVMTKFLLDKIYQKIQTINYYPFSLSWQGNPVLEAGNWIEVEDLQGNKFKTPNLSYSLSFNGGLSAKSSAETVTHSDATYQYKSPLQQKIEWIHARIDAAGGNVVYEGIDEPVNPKEGDLWFKIIGPDKEILIYKKDKDGNLFWDPQISTADIDKVAKEVEEAIEQIKEAEKSANDAVEKADQAIEEAGFAKVDAEKAKEDATKAISDANKAVTDAGTAIGTANTAKTNAGTALTTAQTSLTNSGTAIDKAGQALSKATEAETETGKLTTSYNNLTQTVGLKADKTEVSTIKGIVTQHGLDITANATAVGLKTDKTVTDIINQTVAKHTTDIKATADGLAMKAEKALVDTLNGTVATHTSQIKATADGLGLKADKSLVDTVKGTVDTHTAQIKATSDGLALKAEKSLVDTINGTVNTHTSQIKATSDGLGLKADKTLVDTVKGTVDKHTTDIKANADGLKLKAEASAVNTLTGTVNTHTNQISANATAISARLTSAQVDSLVAGKNYVNQTTLNATANGLSTQITQVSNAVDTAASLAQAMSNGKMLHTDPTFRKGNNGITLYNNSGNGTVTVTRIAKPSDAPTTSTHALQVRTTGTASPGIGGFIQRVDGRANAKFVIRIIAKIPVGYTLLTASNAMGTGNSDKIITSNVGTGKYEEYIRVIQCGSTGSFSNSGHFYLSGAVGTVANPVEWFLAYSTAYDVTDMDYTTIDKFTSIDANINGIQTTVASKADKSQITQLSTQISSKVESATYNSKMTQLDSAINLRVVAKDVTDAILLDKKIKDTRATNQIPSWYFTNYPNQEVREFKTRTVVGAPGSSTYVQLTTKVPWSGSSGGLVTQTAESADGVYQRVSNAASTAWLAWEKVVEAGELLSQINLQSGNILIQTGKLYLDAATVTFSGKAFIPSAAITALAADKITAGTINAANVKLINLDASQITTGTMTGIKIVSPFDYSYDGAIRNKGNAVLTSGELAMNGTFTHSYGGTFMKINPDTIYAENLQNNGSVRSMFKLSGVGLELNVLGKTARYTQDGIYFESGGNASVKYNSGDARIEISSYNGVSLGVNSSGSFYYRMSMGGGQDGLAPFVDVWTDLNLRSTLNVGGNTVKNAAHINGVQDILFHNTSNRIVQGTDNILNIMSPAQINMGYTNGTITSNSLIISNWGTQFSKQVHFNGNHIQGASSINGVKDIMWGGSSNRIVQAGDGSMNILAPIQLNLGWTNGSSTFNTVVITQNQAVIRRTLNMDGNSISNQSDRRLKKDIVETERIVLDSIKNWNFVEYYWKDSDKPSGNQFGLIAQDTPELMVFEEEDDYYGIDSSRQIMLNSKGVQELAFKNDELEEKIKELETKILEMGK
ncbi:tail fiber domain-containing protein [Carnobacterium antarcticum]|uniref:Tail fiber domain-containing protein n=1 Tax=Carnobacterium antarcticum TaxID=2126436 RepID=A0ABW4NMJ4_9LACT|nr:tail fiber domain-containing protein [Carnobacterium sp. CP1]ALV20767.1 Phage tail fiber protein [Carnobacterium sp. CP1]